MIDEKKIQEAVNKSYREAGHNAYFSNGFYAGMEFAIEELESEKQELLEALQECLDRDNETYSPTRKDKYEQLIKRATE
jgi:hypothetical protein